MLSYTIILSLIIPGFADALNPIEIEGSRFYDSVTGTRFFIKGVTYQPRSNGMYDPLRRPGDCKRDAEIMKELGLNAIRVYQTDAGENHDECMKIFDDAGIYVALDIPRPEFSINRLHPSYTSDIYNHYKKKIDTFHKYNNTLLFFAGNEVTNDLNTTAASSFVKAGIRDARKYIRDKNYRHIPVGYANNDDEQVRSNIHSFFNCGKDDERAEFYGLNIYSWCGESSFEQSNYIKRTRELAKFDTPVFLSEYGCNIEPRIFGDIDSLYNRDMNQVFSGGFVYEYSQEENKYGLVELRRGDVIRLPAFYKVKYRLRRAELPLEGKIKKLDAKRLDCPKVNDLWKSSDILPPTPNEHACKCIVEHLECRINPVNGNSHAVEMGKLLDEVCGQGHCTNIGADQSNGIYGTYSFCPLHVKASIALSSASKSGLKKCDFHGIATQYQVSVSRECKEFRPEIKVLPKQFMTRSVTEKQPDVNENRNGGGNLDQNNGKEAPAPIIAKDGDPVHAKLNGSITLTPLSCGLIQVLIFQISKLLV